MGLTRAIRLARGYCVLCNNKREDDPLLCPAHEDREALRSEKETAASNWAGDLVQASGGQELDPLLVEKLLAANGGSASAEVLDIIRLIALMARDDGRQEVAASVRSYVSAYRIPGTSHSPSDTVRADDLIEKIKDYL